MVHLVLPDSSVRRLSFYLAMEDYAAVHFPDSFFLWRVGPTVIFGRNQDMDAEVNVAFCREHGIDMIRRRSGGGCVYADMGNLMISAIYSMGKDCVDTVFDRYLNGLAQVLGSIGMNAVKTQNNDVLVDGHKVSGNAFHVLGNVGVVHGTLLYNVDLSQLQQAITPSREKLESKGIKSVRQRVANLTELGVDVNLQEVQRKLINYFCPCSDLHYLCDSEVPLSDKQMFEIEELEKGYRDINFIKYGRTT